MENGVEDQTNQYLTFKLDEEFFALDISKVREVLDFAPVTKVPQTPDSMLGVINLRGNVVPVIDLRRRFAMAEVEQTVNTCIIIVEAAAGTDALIVGAVADSVQEVLDLEPEQVEPPPRLGTCLKSEYLQGMGKRDGQFLMILDVDEVFAFDVSDPMALDAMEEVVAAEG